MTMQQIMPDLNENTTSTSLQIRRPEPMHFALADSLARAVDALDSGSAFSSPLYSGPRVGLENRRSILLAALAPLPAERIRIVLASLAGMAARAEYDPGIARALADQAVQDLGGVPGFALLEAAEAFRQGKVGDGRWRPMPGELAREARKRAEPFFAELQRIDRVLGSPLLQCEPEKPISPEKRAQLSAMLRSVGLGLGDAVSKRNQSQDRGGLCDAN